MFTERRLAALPKPIAALADVPQLSAEELKQYFDGNAEALRLSVNGLADDGAVMEAKMEGIIAQTYEGTIHESMLDQPLTEKLDAKADQTALAAEAAAREQDRAALLTQIATCAVVQIGSYTGDGTANRIIHLGYQPKAVLLTSVSGAMTYQNNCYGGIALPNQPLYTAGDPTRIGLAVVANGFQVTYVYGQYLYTNSSGMPYFFIAFR